jgi:putative transcriptional regulator
MPAGRSFPRHLHPGREDVLVLKGGYEDERGHYEAGEYAVYEPGSVHRPATARDEECWILIRLEKPIRLLGWRGWVQSLLPGIG